MGVPRSPKQNEVDPEDYDLFMKDLQNLIEHAPQGYQAKFARVIASLNQRKLRRIVLQTVDELNPNSGDQVNFEELLKILQREMEQTHNPSDRFNMAMEIARTRAQRTDRPDATPEEKAEEEAPSETKPETENKTPAVQIFDKDLL